eukprot:m.1056943 g.1056943  ORF g.1056943 m.1056943 type:complete len:82 (+) comp24203_c0_seq3:1684-1929(+)
MNTCTGCYGGVAGFGQSQGPALKSRSEFNVQNGGACDLVVSVMDALMTAEDGTPTFSVVGYDWLRRHCTQSGVLPTVPPPS